MTTLLVGIFTFIGSVLATLLITYYFSTRRRLSYVLISKARLVARDNEIGKKLKIIYEDKQVEDVYLFEIKVLNSGNAPIRPEDYTQPIIIDFGSESIVLTAELIAKNPNSLDVEYAAAGNEIRMERFLLNRGDYLVVKSLVSHPSDFVVGGRISGIRKIVEEPKTFLRISGIMLALITIITLTTYFIVQRIQTVKGSGTWAGYLLLGGVVLVYACFFVIGRREKKFKSY